MMRAIAVSQGRDGVLAAAGRACGCSRRPDASDPAEVAAPTFTDEPAVS